MKLYELKKGTWFNVVDKTTKVPPGAPKVRAGFVYKLNNIDGMYSHCQDYDGNVYHLAAWTEVEEVPSYENSH
jgi:hypothetical protein